MARYIVVDDLISKFVLSGFCRFAQSEITELNVSLRIYQDIVRFQISMNVVFSMNIVDSENLSRE